VPHPRCPGRILRVELRQTGIVGAERRLLLVWCVRHWLALYCVKQRGDCCVSGVALQIQYRMPPRGGAPGVAGRPPRAFGRSADRRADDTLRECAQLPSRYGPRQALLRASLAAECPVRSADWWRAPQHPGRGCRTPVSKRTARIALLLYADGEKRYIIAPKGHPAGRCDRVRSGRRYLPRTDSARPDLQRAPGRSSRGLASRLPARIAHSRRRGAQVQTADTMGCPAVT
jgi:hypothetical protein